MKFVVLGLIVLFSSHAFLKDSDAGGKLHGAYGFILGILLFLYGIKQLIF